MQTGRFSASPTLMCLGRADSRRDASGTGAEMRFPFSRQPVLCRRCCDSSGHDSRVLATTGGCGCGRLQAVGAIVLCTPYRGRLKRLLCGPPGVGYPEGSR